VARCDDYLRGDSVKIRFYAHASFRLEVDGFAVITDPYTPGPHNSGFDSIDEPADVVIMSSATDSFHSDPSHVRGDPTDAAIEAIGPPVVISMHYYSSRGVLDIEPVDAFLERYPADSVTRVNGSELELTPESLHAEALHIYVLEQSR
jgi:L-ascorbate metabolism protein UlaG (beta-lactamase superfamily)